MASRSWLGMLAVTVLVVACGGGASPTAAPTAVPSGLPAGEYRSNAFLPPIRYTLPEGWVVAGDSPDYFGLNPVTSDLVGIHVFRSPRPASQDPDCPTEPAPGVGTTASDLVGWIRARPGLVVGDPVAVSIGGLIGTQIDVGIVDGWLPSCPFANGVPTVPLFVGATDDSFRWVVSGSERLRLNVVDVPNAGTIVVDVDAFDGSMIDPLIEAAGPIVESMRFGLP